eukprot:GFUD01017653.1.p1 GENE.GFUD01017653.1~~GFUD01017653.1.p1  ORF type:complete len:405 (+),score=125.37 GFUD01017653.1:113-1327(+)
MALSEGTVTILKACHPVLLANREDIGATFYKILFRDNPELRNIFNLSHFKTDKDGKPGPQMLSLSDAVISFAAYCDQLEQLGPLVERVAHKHVSFGVRSEHYPVVGRALLQALEDVLGKVVFNDAVKSAVMEGYYFLAHIFIANEEGKMQENEDTEGGWRGWRNLVLVKKVAETPIHTSFYFAPEDGSQLMTFIPGQYISIRIPGSPYSMVRNYSLSSSPTSSMYRITVKKENNGQVSSYLHDKAKEGDVLEIGVPSGEFVTDNGNSPIVLIGAGTGITPLVSMLKDAAERSLQATLIYRAHSKETHPLNKEVEDIVRYESDNISVHLFYSVNSAGIDISKEYSARTLDKIIPDKKSLFYLCGPQSFTSDTAGYLKSVGVRPERIQIEQFGPLVVDTQDIQEQK